MDWSDLRRAGATFSEGKKKPELAVYSSLRRGWMFGSQEFREKMLKLLQGGGKKMRRANGYGGAQLNDYGEMRANALIEAGMKTFRMELEEIRALPKGDKRKGLLAALIQDETTMKLDWIADRLRKGTRAGVFRLAKAARSEVEKDRKAAMLKIQITLVVNA